MPRRQLRCSFCRRGEAEVAKLVAGPRVYICDACVAVASRLMEADVDGSTQSPPAATSLWRRLTARAGWLVRRRGGDRLHVEAVV